MSNNNGIARLRAALGWTMEDLGAYLEVSRQTISYYEKGTFQPTPDKAWKLVWLARENGKRLRLEDVYPEPGR